MEEVSRTKSANPEADVLEKATPEPPGKARDGIRLRRGANVKSNGSSYSDFLKGICRIRQLDGRR